MKKLWGNIMRQINIIIFIIVISILSLSCSINEKDDYALIKETIEKFYDTQYKAYLELEYKDITPFLDMTKIQNQNKVI
ncbi:hypothetical protein ciss_18480, partial [Carboxydothermus islandicus]